MLPLAALFIIRIRIHRNRQLATLHHQRKRYRLELLLEEATVAMLKVVEVGVVEAEVGLVIEKLMVSVPVGKIESVNDFVI